jgi:hypothetical protein
LNEVDEVSAGVLKQDGGDWSHALWFTAETDTKLLQTWYSESISLVMNAVAGMPAANNAF